MRAAAALLAVTALSFVCAKNALSNSLYRVAESRGFQMMFHQFPL